MPDFLRGLSRSGHALVVGGERRSGEEALDATEFAAVAERAGTLGIGWPGQRIVAPFAGDGIDAGKQPAADDDAAADPGPEDDAEDRPCAGGGAVDGLREGKTVGIVGHPDLARERGRDVAVERMADQASRISVLDQAGSGRDGARHSDAACATLPQLGLQTGTEAADR